LATKSDRSEVSIYYPETIQGEKIMNLELYQQVYLNRDLTEYQLKKGDIATLIDFVPHPHNQEEFSFSSCKTICHTMPYPSKAV